VIKKASVLKYGLVFFIGWNHQPILESYKEIRQIVIDTEQAKKYSVSRYQYVFRG